MNGTVNGCERHREWTVNGEWNGTAGDYFPIKVGEAQTEIFGEREQIPSGSQGDHDHG